MKKILLAVAIFAGVVSCSDAQSSFSIQTLDHELLDTSSQKVDFRTIAKSTRGKVTVYEFWASWCGDCVKAMDKVKAMQQAHPEVNYIFISLDKTPEKWLAGIEKHQLKGQHFLVTDPEGMKGKFGQSLSLDWIPRYLITNKRGEIILFRAIEKDFEKINKTLESLK